MSASSSYRTTVEHLIDLQQYVGMEIGISDWIKIDQEAINDFARLTHDEQWIHTDEERAAKESPYGVTIAHGFMVLSFCSRFIASSLKVENQVMGINYGLNRVRFPNAVKVNSRIRGRVSLVGYEEIEKGARLLFEVHFQIEGESKPACISENVALCYIKRT